MKILSIIVPVYNAGKYLACCVQSLLDQDISPYDYEIILINDGSTDKSLQIAEDFEKKYPQVKVISQTNQGVSEARNRGLGIAEGKYILFVDSDDFIEPHSVHKIISLSEENNLELCSFRARVEYEDGRYIDKESSYFDHNKIFSGNFIITHGMNFSSIWYTLYRSSKLKEINLFFSFGIVQEDVEFCMKLYPLCSRIMFTDEIVYHYRNFGDSLTRNVSTYRIQEQYLSNLQIAQNIFSYLRINKVNQKVKSIYEKKMNSMLVSQMMNIYIKKKVNEKSFLDVYIKQSKEMGLYPVGHNTMSWRTFIMSYFINSCLFEYLFILK